MWRVQQKNRLCFHSYYQFYYLGSKCIFNILGEISVRWTGSSSAVCHRYDQVWAMHILRASSMTLDAYEPRIACHKILCINVDALFHFNKISSIKKRDVNVICKERIETKVFIKFLNFIMVLLVQFEREYMQVGLDALFAHTLGKHSYISFDTPTQKHLSRRLSMLGCNGFDHIMVQQGSGCLCRFRKDSVWAGAKGWVSSNLNILLLNPLDKGCLLQIRVKLN